MTRAALDVAGLVERGENLFAELAALQKDLGHHVRRHVGEAGQIAETLEIQNVV